MGEEELAMLRSLRIRLARLVINSAVVTGTAWSPALPPVGAQERDVLAEEGRKLFVQQGCYGCHTIGTSRAARADTEYFVPTCDRSGPFRPPIFNTLSDFEVH